MDNLDRYLELALRAQSQSRATWKALAAIKKPARGGLCPPGQHRPRPTAGEQYIGHSRWHPARERKPKSAKQTIGKAVVSRNADSGTWRLLRELSRALREQNRRLNTDTTVD